MSHLARLAALEAAFEPGHTTTKRVTMPISGCGGTANVTTYTDWCQRSVILLPVTTTRWRLRVQNASAAGNTVTAGAYTLADTYVGAPQYASDGSWTGAFTTGSTPAKALTGQAMPTDGSEYVSPWVTDPAMQFAADTPGVISWGATCGAGQSLVSDANRVALLFAATGLAAKTGQVAAPSGTPVKNVTLLDVRVEYETVTNLPVVLYLGDSTTAGQTDDDTLTPLGPGPHSPFPGAAALRNRHLAINAGIGGAPALTLYGRPITAVQWTRFDLATTVPDVCVISIGINDVNVGTALTTFRNRLGSIRSFVASNLGIRRFLVTTVMTQPRWAAASTQDNLRLSYNDAIAAGINGLEDVIDFAQAIKPTDDLTHLWGTGTIHPGARVYKLLGALVKV